MKKAAKFLIPLILGLLIIASIFWYLFIYDRAFTRDTLLNQARYQDINGNSRLSSWFYDAAYNFSGHDENILFVRHTAKTFDRIHYHCIVP